MDTPDPSPLSPSVFADAAHFPPNQVNPFSHFGQQALDNFAFDSNSFRNIDFNLSPNDPDLQNFHEFVDSEFLPTSRDLQTADLAPSLEKAHGSERPIYTAVTELCTRNTTSTDTSSSRVPQDISTAPAISPDMDVESTVGRGLGCPIFEAEILVAPDNTTCNGLTAPNMSRVRTHLNRQHVRKEQQPGVGIKYLKYCKRCKTHFVNKELHETSHGAKKCRNDRPRKTQQEEWIALSTLLYGPALAQRSYDSNYTPDTYVIITLTRCIDSIARKKTTTPVNSTPEPFSTINPSISQSLEEPPPAKRLCTACGHHSNNRDPSLNHGPHLAAGIDSASEERAETHHTSNVQAVTLPTNLAFVYMVRNDVTCLDPDPISQREHGSEAYERRPGDFDVIPQLAIDGKKMHQVSFGSSVSFETLPVSSSARQILPSIGELEAPVSVSRRPFQHANPEEHYQERRLLPNNLSFKDAPWDPLRLSIPTDLDSTLSTVS
ncbi:predicted protein [Pyrenophora tritici-repentis Pt-1C-BFP]|uniref:Uncharacterized protein n=1 Tax=Pyrenophora tritici-repentis (strain Pt-1C-BFP) TaxID=426418 RepID=B2VYS9_PYRTR|nr:uncharacterized protein PTRG_02569 [Pyrenophora tritici-repentis Pt-1C-BFP]EDU45092.1 predicted protein [Pyrenophora tritici-repentis Pt-1C-BFP]